VSIINKNRVSNHGDRNVVYDTSALHPNDVNPITLLVHQHTAFHLSERATMVNIHEHYYTDPRSTPRVAEDIKPLQNYQKPFYNISATANDLQ
jgi:hypothetical protein